ncbi:MAG: peptidoglycan-associated lipoprotein, partial [Bradyrhizobium sp. 35-63-5]
MIEIGKFLRGARLVAVLAVALAVTACANQNGVGGNGQGTAAGNATPGSQQDFVVNVGDRVFFTTDQTDLSQVARATLDKQAQWLTNYGQY